MNTDNELKNHIIYEFYAGLPNKENMLFETRGAVANLTAVMQPILDEMYGQAKDICGWLGRLQSSSTKTYYGSLKEKGIDTFFDKYCIELTIKYGHEKNKFSGGILPNDTFKDTDNGVLCEPAIEYNVEGDDPTEIMKLIKMGIGHELTHAYNMYMYAKKNGLKKDDIYKNAFETQRYKAIQNARNNGPENNDRAIGNILYLLNRMERNAYIAEIRQELEDMADTIKDSDSAWKAVMATEGYKKFKSLETNMKIMTNGFLSPEVKEGLLRTSRAATGRNFEDYEHMVKYYLRYWDVWKKKFLSTAAKIAYDVFEEHNQMIGGPEPTDTIIR